MIPGSMSLAHRWKKKTKDHVMNVHTTAHTYTLAGGGGKKNN